MIESIKKHKSIIGTAGLLTSFVVLLIFSILCFTVWNEDNVGIALAPASAFALFTFFKHLMESGDIEGIKRGLTQLKESIDRWQREHLQERHKEKGDGTPFMASVVSKSPLTITKEGTDLLIESGAQEYLDEKIDSWIGKFNKTSTPYYIQQKALEVIEKDRDNIEQKVEEYLYKKGLDITAITYPMRIKLRDMVIERKGHETE